MLVFWAMAFRSESVEQPAKHFTMTGTRSPAAMVKEGLRSSCAGQRSFHPLLVRVALGSSWKAMCSGSSKVLFFDTVLVFRGDVVAGEMAARRPGYSGTDSHASTSSRRHLSREPTRMGAGPSLR